MLSRVAMGPAGDEKGVVLRDTDATCVDRGRGDHQRVRSSGRAVGRLDRQGRVQRDDRILLGVPGAQHHPKGAAGSRNLERSRRIERHPHTPRGEAESGVHAQSAIRRRGDPQTPSDAAKTDSSAQVDDRLAQPILKIGQMIGGDHQAIDELGMSVIRHLELLRTRQTTIGPTV
jgi:hypothetical protein